MALQTVKATIQMRIGNEEDFDPDQMTAGEWAVSKDTKKVWMCFRPGFVLRMATYEAFEEDMREIQTILATCRDIQTAVEAFEQLAEQHKSQAEEWSNTSESWAVGGTGTRTGENTDNSKYYSEQSKKYKEAAEKAKEDAEKIVFDDTVPISKGGTGATETGEATNNLVAQSLAPSIYIPANSDLNDYIVPGCYSVLDSTVSKTIANTPVTGAGYMLSVYIPNGAKSSTKSRVQIVQLFYAATYARYRDNSGVWSNWIQRKYSDTTYSAATQSTNGLMSAADKKKMDGIEERANKTTLTANLLATVPGTALDATMGKQLKDELNSLSTSLTSSTKTEVINTGGINATFSFQKFGKIVLVQIQFVKAAIPHEWTPIVNIPDDYQPRINGVTSGIDINGNHIIVTTENNVIKVYSKTDIDVNYLYASIAYISK